MPKKPPLGFSLLEVLVALLVLSVGIMSLLSVQASNRYHSGQLRWYAADLAAKDMVGRLQAQGALLQHLNSATTIDCAHAVSLCQAIQTWQDQLQHRLPGARGTVQQINHQWRVRVCYPLGGESVQIIRYVFL